MRTFSLSLVVDWWHSSVPHVTTKYPVKIISPKKILSNNDNGGQKIMSMCYYHHSCSNSDVLQILSTQFLANLLTLQQYFGPTFEMFVTEMCHFPTNPTESWRHDFVFVFKVVFIIFACFCRHCSSLPGRLSRLRYVVRTHFVIGSALPRPQSHHDLHQVPRLYCPWIYLRMIPEKRSLARSFREKMR